MDEQYNEQYNIDIPVLSKWFIIDESNDLLPKVIHCKRAGCPYNIKIADHVKYYGGSMYELYIYKELTRHLKQYHGLSYNDEKFIQYEIYTWWRGINWF